MIQEFGEGRGKEERNKEEFEDWQRNVVDQFPDVSPFLAMTVVWKITTNFEGKIGDQEREERNMRTRGKQRMKRKNRQNISKRITKKILETQSQQIQKIKNMNKTVVQSQQSCFLQMIPEVQANWKFL